MEIEGLSKAGSAPATVAVPAVDDLGENPARPIDPVEERRVDIAPRSPQRIQFLLLHESAEQTQERIANDKARYKYARPEPKFPERSFTALPQTRIIES